MQLIATFPGSHAALAAERALLDAGLAVELIPVPRQIHSDCGFCLLAEAGDPGTSAADGCLRALRASGAREFWRVGNLPAAPGQRKERTYERIP